MATVEDLDMDALVRILTEPKNALTRQYARMFEMDEVELVFTEDSLEAIAAQAIKRGTGARGLRAILEEVLLNTMYDLPSRSDVERVVIDRDVVAEKVNPTLVPAREPDRPAEKSA
jgi:ATP-dependent Clp protease ATP-binding subunit ClpX